MRLVVPLVAAVTVLLVRTSTGATDSADVVVYADHVPAMTQSNTPFVNPFTDPIEAPDDTPTRILVSTSPGLRLPLGSSNWGAAAWGKYVLIGNYDEGANGVFQVIEDQRVGVFDSETHAFCELDIDPDEDRNGSVQFLVVANPGAQQTRIYFEGIAGTTGPSFGYIEADMSNPNPCDAVTGWNVVRFTAADLNAAAPPSTPACPESDCGFDGLSLIDPTTVQLNGWRRNRVLVVRVGAGVLDDVWVHPLPYWNPIESNACFHLLPVGRAAVDPTRPPNDVRFASMFDTQCFEYDPAAPQPAGCAPFIGMCPLSGASCTVGTTCAGQGYCEKTFLGSQYACDDDADCDFEFFCGVHPNLGACRHDCKPIHPARVCSGNTSQHCSADNNCASGQRCICNKPFTHPGQEYRFDGNAITPTSVLFQPAQNASVSPLGRYDSLGNLWVDATSQTGSPYPGVPALYFRQGNGHAYDSTISISLAVPPNQAIPFEAANIYQVPIDINQLGNDMYMIGSRSLQRARLGFSGWALDASYKLSLGFTVLPSEAHVCTPEPSCANTYCDDEHPCASGSCVPAGDAVGPFPKFILPNGGSPNALWSTASFTTTNGTAKNLYLFRIPVATNVPDGASGALGGENVRPAIAWSGDRLWMVAEHNGALKYRVRDDGFWSAWQSFTVPITAKGAAAVAASATGVEVFVRSTADSKVYGAILANPTCTPGPGCSWSGWTLVSGSPVATHDPAVTFKGVTQPTLVVRGSDGVLRYSQRFVGVWSSWTAMTGLVAEDAPSVAWNPVDGSSWVVARESGTGSIRYSRILSNTTFTAWADAGTGGAVAWRAAPAIAWNGAQMRVFAPANAFPNTMYQTVWDGTSWGSWRPLVSGSGATRQAAVADVNGEINVVSYWFTSGAQETSVDPAPPS
jgi:hypothetical protein